jgi:hypothetical protein
MIILRQKAFTRAEREALKQLYKVTNGFRQFPGGVTSLEDARALKKLAIKLNEGKVGNQISGPEIRDALDRLGLTKLTNKELQHINNKYNNQVLINRARKIYSGRSVEFKFKKEPDVNPISLPTSSKNPSLPLMRFSKKKLGTSVIETKPLNPETGKAVIPGATVAENSSQEEINSGLRLLDGVVETNAKGYGKDARRLFESGKNRRLLVTNRTYPEESTLHEISHTTNTVTIPDSNNYDPNISKVVTPHYKTIVGNVGEIAEENLANARTLYTLRRKTEGVNKKLLDHSLNTYVQESRRIVPKIKR